MAGANGRVRTGAAIMALALAGAGSVVATQGWRGFATIAGTPAPAVSAAQVDQARSSLLRAPLAFVANTGALDDRVAFWLPGAQASVYLTDAGLTYRLAPPAEGPGWVVRQDFVGAAAVRPVSVQPSPTTVNVFRGAPSAWRTAITTAATVGYPQLWPGVDATYAGTGERLKYEFTVAPGADPSAIRLAYRGAERVALGPGGALRIETPAGGFTDDAPTAYQDVDGTRVPVSVSYALAPREPDGSQPYGFALGAYDPSRPLVIDPATIVYAGFIGGTGDDRGRGIAVDAAGAAYVAGRTASNEVTFPEAVGPDLTANGFGDAFVAKVAPDGASLVYAGFLGGNGVDAANDIAVDATGAAYVTGSTGSNNFPVVVGPGHVFVGQNDAFVAKVDPTGASLVYAGYIGGIADDLATGIAVDAAGAAYLTGLTHSSAAAGFPVAVGPDFTHNGGGADAFVAKVVPGGASLAYSGFIGGSASDEGTDIAVDAAGAAYVSGGTTSDAATFPVAGGPGLTPGGGGDAFVAKVDPGGASLTYAGFIGGSGAEAAFGVDVDAAGAAYVTGNTTSTESTFPVAVGPDLTANGGNDLFVAKVDPGGTGLAYAGFIGGSADDFGNRIAVDAAGNVYVTGRTASSDGSFPATSGPDLTYNGGAFDAIVAKVAPGGANLVYAGFVGGSGDDLATGIAIDATGAAYIAGSTGSIDGTFPVAGGPDLNANGTFDAFVAKIAAASFSIDDVTLSEGDAGTTTFTFTITRSGDTSSAATVDVATADGSAGAPSDYTAVALTTVSFAAGETTKPVSVTVNGDTSVEANDGFSVHLSNPVGAGIADGTGVGRITNDDAAAFSINDVTVTEGNAGTVTATFTVSRSGDTADAATVQWRTLDVHASAGSDYLAVPPTTLSFAGGETSRMVSVTVNGDTAVEPTEDFYVRLTGPTGFHTIADATGVGTITNDDPPVNSLSIGDATVAEDDSETEAATFTVTRTGDTSQAASVQWFTVAGTATAGEDFFAVAPTTLSFGAGETSKPVVVNVKGDTVVEANEAFFVRLASPVGATIADGSGLGRITNDDAATFSVNDVTVTEGDEGTTTASFTVTRSGDVEGTATVAWSTANGTATAGSDYVAVPLTTLTFGPEETTRSAVVTINGDTATEANETFQVRLTSPAGGSLADSSGLGRITNDD